MNSTLKQQLATIFPETVQAIEAEHKRNQRLELLQKITTESLENEYRREPDVLWREFHPIKEFKR